jgi:diguanylate cyclase (GGDEF)-like protein
MTGATAFARSAARGKRAVIEVVLAALAVAAVGLLDVRAPNELDATVLYLGIVTIMAWKASAAVAFATAFGAWATSLGVDLGSNPTSVGSVVVWNGGAGLAIAVGVAMLVRKVRVERDALQIASTHDRLTGLPNRVVLRDRLEQALRAATREESSVAVLVFDLDGFKQVNDTLGHHAGDQLLRLTAERVRGAIRSADTCARIGGDEFAILLARRTRAGAERVVDTVRRGLLGPGPYRWRDIVGRGKRRHSALTRRRNASRALLRFADRRMYEAKAQPRAARDAASSAHAISSNE